MKTPKEEKPWKERRVWLYPCVKKCGRKARSHTKDRAKAGLCKICERGRVNPNQTALFTDVAPEAETVLK